MATMTTLRPAGTADPAVTLGGYREGWSLPGAAYTDDAYFRAEMARVFGTGWLYLGPSAALTTGTSQTWTVAGESVIVTRDDAGLHAFANVCAHRGSRLLDADGLSVQRRIVCPYHSWAYDSDGSLAGAPHMGKDFCREDHHLARMPVRELAGLLFVSLLSDPDEAQQHTLDADFVAMEAAYAPHLTPYALGETQVAAEEHYRVAANWKTVTENNRECYHCRSNHPEFCLTNYEFGMSGDPRSSREYEAELKRQTESWAQAGLPTYSVSFPDGLPFRVARLPLKPGCVTESMTGERLAPLLGSVQEGSGSVRMICLPNMWLHLNCDYAMLTRVTPIDAATTDVDVTYLVRRGAVEGVDYEPQALTAVWDATSKQDWELSERNYRGQSSRAYRPGPLSPVTESSVMVFHDWYLTRMGVPAVA